MKECPSTAYASEAAIYRSGQQGMAVLPQQRDVHGDTPVTGARCASDQKVAHDSPETGIDTKRLVGAAAQRLQRIKESRIVPVFAAASARTAFARQLFRTEVRPAPAGH